MNFSLSKKGVFMPSESIPLLSRRKGADEVEAAPPRKGNGFIDSLL